MPATKRLFAIIQALRTARVPIRAQQLADLTEVSVRTIYRDIDELRAQGTPIFGEAGIGYELRAGYDLPPLMLNIEELEAAFVGASWVMQKGDVSLAKGAETFLSKIAGVIPEELRTHLLNPVVVVPDLVKPLSDKTDTSLIREAIREKKKINIYYKNLAGEESERTVWPFMFAYFESARVVVAWCQIKEDFRHFRTDQILKLQIMDEVFNESIGSLKNRWQLGRNDEF